jgi:hypothetical protein
MARFAFRQLFLTLTAVLITTCEKPAFATQDSEIPKTPAAKEDTAARKKSRIDEAAQIAALIDPAKLATLKERGANSRIQKITAILATAKLEGKNPDEITREAVAKIGWGGTAKGELTAAAILRNLNIAEKLGAITPGDIAAMRKGNAATVRKGPYAGETLSVDHIIPRATFPELDNVVANLELLPLRLNQAKGNKIGSRQRDLAKKFHAVGLMKTPPPWTSSKPSSDSKL